MQRSTTMRAAAVAMTLALAGGCGGSGSSSRGSDAPDVAIPSVDEGIERAQDALCDASLDTRTGIANFVAGEFDRAPDSIRQAFLDADLSVRTVAETIAGDDYPDVDGDDALNSWLDYISESANQAARRVIENFQAGMTC